MSFQRFTLVMGAAALALGLLATPREAAATAFCNVKKTADGFVALRAGPAPSARMVGRMKAGDEVMLGQGKKGDWVEVTWYRGDDRHSKGFHAKSGAGWVNRKLIDEECG